MSVLPTSWGVDGRISAPTSAVAGSTCTCPDGGGFDELLLGSTNTHVTHHARTSR